MAADARLPSPDAWVHNTQFKCRQKKMSDFLPSLGFLNFLPLNKKNKFWNKTQMG